MELGSRGEGKENDRVSMMLKYITSVKVEGTRMC
jgi:hypothetical protein